MVKFVTELIKSAETDLKASSILYNYKLYSKSVFLFHQSVEKTNKAFSLMMKNINPDELKKKIGHYTTKIHEEHFRKEEERLIKFQENKNIFPKLELIQTKEENSKKLKSISELRKKLIEIRKDPNKFRIISEEEINILLDEIDEVKEEINQSGEPKFDEFNEEDFNSGIDEYLSLLRDIYGEFIADEHSKSFEELKKNPKIILESLKIFSNYIYYYTIPYIECLGLAILTTPHADIRYPTKDNKFIPDKFYNKKLPFIIKLPELFEHQKECIDKLFILRKFIETTDGEIKH